MKENAKYGIEKTKYLLDTDVLINHLSKKRDTLNKLSEKENISISLSVLNKFELFRGIDDIKDKDTADDVIRYFDVYPVSELIADRASELAKLKNIPAGPVDILIAATCIENNLILVTENIKHFKNIPGLVIYKE
ncbi:MAG: hypothetical protein A2231_02500 [Candidatus Firestonebacteria bacterium RIFOXYA2_FULL_40_8]|nr:MAG: hypothetical protein A2231_02500 [Candidatus Firestonebacteria bacterium RIFOXYA2_FULL_40_8]